MTSSALVLAFKYFAVDLFYGIVGFPMWWYTRGLAIATHYIFNSINSSWQNLGLGIWIKNLFTPMYGESSISGRAISIFMRFVVLIAKLVVFLFLSLFYLIIFLFYVAILPVAVFGVIYNFAL